jgi:hypothetical protein
MFHVEHALERRIELRDVDVSCGIFWITSEIDLAEVVPRGTLRCWHGSIQRAIR